MNDKLNDALNEISNNYIAEAASYQKTRRPYWIGAVAAVLALVILFAAIGKPGTSTPSEPILFYPPGTTGTPTQPTETITPPETTVPEDPTTPTLPQPVLLANQICAPTLPWMAEYSADYFTGYSAWQDSQNAQYDQPDGYADSLDNFFAASIQQFLSGDGNQTYSPVNVYMALAMLAETAQGESRQQILDLLGAQSIESLREQASYVWNAHYSADGMTSLLLANSLWLDEAYSFASATVDTLAKDHYASLFSGDLGSDELNEQLRQWLNDSTGNLLQEQVEGVSLSPETIVALASTIYFRAGWTDKFSEEDTTQDIFHTPYGDVTVDFMHQSSQYLTYYWGENYSAIRLGLSGDNDMWLILPDEESSTAEVLESGVFLTMLQNPVAWTQSSSKYQINLSLPKFDVVSQKSLVAGLQKLGVTDVFDKNRADLHGLITSDSTDVNPFIGSIDHAARVTIDEEGCEAAAFTVIQFGVGMVPQEKDEIDFTLDRPFIFVITSRDNLPLFAGTVNEP